MKAEILVQRADGSSERKSLVDGVYEIGRESGDIVLGDPNVSNGHASLRVTSGTVVVTDNHSTNGTFDYSGQRLSEPYVISGDRGVRLGNSAIQIAPAAGPSRGGTHVMQAFPEPTNGASTWATASTSAMSPTVATAAVTTTKRAATVLKAPDVTPGLLLVDGRQVSFGIEGVWRVAAVPNAGMSVEVEFDAMGNVVAITAADPTALMREQGQKVVNLAQSGLSLAIARMGKVPFFAAVALVLGWFFMPALSLGPLLSLTFWDLSNANLGSPLGLMQGEASWGLLGLIGLVAVLAPFAQLNKPKLRLLNAAPAAFLGLWFLRQVIGIGGAVMEAREQEAQARRALEGFMGGRVGTEPAGESMVDSLGSMIGGMLWDQLSFGLGLWVVVIASGVLFVQVFRREGVVP